MSHSSAVAQTVKTAEQPAANATPAKWGFSLGAFGMEGSQVVASAVLRRFLDSPAPTLPPDATPALLEASRGPAAAIEVGGVAAMTAERAKAVELIALCAKLAADVQRKRSDPALLADLDFSKRLRELDAEAATISSRRQEAETALRRADHQLNELRAAAAIHLRAVITKVAQAASEATADQQRRLVIDAAQLLTPIIEQMYGHNVSRHRRPNIEAVVEAMLVERGFAPTVRSAITSEESSGD